MVPLPQIATTYVGVCPHISVTTSSRFDASLNLTVQASRRVEFMLHSKVPRQWGRNAARSGAHGHRTIISRGSTMESQSGAGSTRARREWLRSSTRPSGAVAPVSPNSVPESAEPHVRKYPLAARVALLVLGAIASWALVFALSHLFLS